MKWIANTTEAHVPETFSSVQFNSVQEVIAFNRNFSILNNISIKLSFEGKQF